MLNDSGDMNLGEIEPIASNNQSGEMHRDLSLDKFDFEQYYGDYLTTLTLSVLFNKYNFLKIRYKLPLLKFCNE